MLFGKDCVKYLIVVFTGRDNLDRDGQTIEDYVQEMTGVFKDLLVECDNRYVAFDNTFEPTSADNKEQVQQLFDLADKILKENGGKYFTNDMLSEAHRSRKEAEEREKQQKAEFEKKTNEMKMRQQELQKQVELERQRKREQERVARLRQEQQNRELEKLNTRMMQLKVEQKNTRYV